MYVIEYRDLLIVLPMREPSIFLGIAVSLSFAACDWF